MRNRAPDTTLLHIHTEVKRQYEGKVKKPLRKKDFPKMPRSLITKTARKDIVDWIVKNLGLTRKQASHYNQMGLEKFRIMRARTDAFTEYVVEFGTARYPGKKYKRGMVLKDIQALMTEPTIKGFFKALRSYYRTVAGVPPDGIQALKNKATT